MSTGRQGLHPRGWPRPAVTVPVRAVKGLPSCACSLEVPPGPRLPLDQSPLRDSTEASLAEMFTFWRAIAPLLRPALEAGRSATSPWSLMKLRGSMSLWSDPVMGRAPFLHPQPQGFITQETRSSTLRTPEHPPTPEPRWSL